MSKARQLMEKADRLQRRHAWLAFPVAVWRKYNEDQGGYLAALIAYYSFVAIFPLLLVAVTVLALVLRGHQGLQVHLLHSALANYPLIGKQLLANVHELGQTGFALAAGLAVTFLGASGAASAMQNAMNTAWQIPYAGRPGFPWSTLRNAGIVIVIGVGEGATTLLSGLAAGPVHVLSGAAARLAAIAVALLLNGGLFWLAFRLACASNVTWRSLLPGAVLAAACWQVLQFLGGYFVGNQLAHSSQLYGTFGLVLGLIAWLYLQAEVTIYAVEASVVHSRGLWPRSLAPPPFTEQDRRAFQLTAQTQRRHPQERVIVQVTDSEGPK